MSLTKFFIALTGLAVLAILCLSVAGQAYTKVIQAQVAEFVGESSLPLADIPLTEHAKTSVHNEQAYNAASIKNIMLGQGCRPVYSQLCWEGEELFDTHLRLSCELPPPGSDKYIGLVIGKKTGSLKVVTGYQARVQYWKSDRNGHCLPPIVFPINAPIALP